MIDANRATRWWYRVATGLIGFYCVYVVLGKVGQKAGFALPVQLGDVGEFLVVLAGMAAFVAGLLLTAPPEEQDEV
jgi:hypothetical protein